ncbi:MAG: hypothetical protein ACPK85_11940 [Methanosarcina sp.]
MLGTFLDKAASLLDRQFLLAYWYPALLSLSLGLLLFSWPNEWNPLNEYFSALQSGSFSSQLMIILGTLLLTLFLAYLLQAFSLPFVQFWEGYWPESFWKWYMADNVEQNWKELKKKRVDASSKNPILYASLQEQLFYGYPSQKDRLLPTQLGNIIRAAEDYAQSRYGMDTVFWWPRLWLLLPESVKQQIDSSLAPMIFLLNLTTQLGILSIIGSIYLFMQYWGPWKLWAIPVSFTTLIVGITLTTLTYRGALYQAKAYGVLIRSAVDNYRFDLLKTLHQKIPKTLSDEKKLWEDLVRWIYLNEQRKAPFYEP